MAEQDELPLYDESEFVVGLVCAAGVNYRRCTHVLEAEFKRMGYDTRTVRLSTLMDNLAMNYDLTTVRESLPEGARIRARMSLGNQLRARASNCSIMALAAIQEINQHRISLDGTGTEPALRTVHIVATLKRPEEVEALRQVYGAGFFLLGVHDTEEGRTKYLTEQMGVAEDEAKLLMRDDLYDQQDAGQLTRDTYYLSDVFVSLVAGRYKEQIVRFVELLFSHPYHTPTRDEHAMAMAYYASLRSAQMGRQVGAAVLARTGDLVSVGCNDVPKPGGGQYWCNDPEDFRDHKLSADSNDIQKQRIVADTLKRLGLEPMDDALVKARLDGSLLSDITEFGRAMHAEMDAILTCARNGISVLDGTLYTTTFPCHNCARHILGAGIGRVVYIEPYAKSAALELHTDGITVDEVKENDLRGPRTGRIPFESFVGIGPRRYGDLFPMRPNYGQMIKRKRDGVSIDWPKDGKRPRIRMHPVSYLRREQVSVEELRDTLADGRRHDGKQETKRAVRGVSGTPPKKRTRSQKLA